MGTGRPTTSDATRVIRKEHSLALEGQSLADPNEPAPDWMDELAASQWLRLLPMLCAQGLAAVDLSILETYCDAYSQWRTASETLRREGQTLLNNQGKQYTHPCAAQARTAAESMRKIGASLGISAASRSRIKVPPKKSAEKSALQAFQEEANP